MKKGIVVALCIIALFLLGGFAYIRYTPPLVANNGFASTSDEKVKLLRIGNQYPFGNIEMTDVMVNGGEQPLESKIQVSTHRKGFIITGDFDGEEVESYTFKSLKNIEIPPNTAPGEQLKKWIEGKASDDDFIYAANVSHEEKIDQITIQYEYLGMSYDLIVGTN